MSSGPGESDDLSVFSEAFPAEQQVVLADETDLAPAASALTAVLAELTRMGAPEQVRHLWQNKEIFIIIINQVHRWNDANRVSVWENENCARENRIYRMGLCYEITHFYISYHYLSIMPPKKKINKAADQPAPVEPAPKTSEKVEPVPEQKKQEPKPEKQEKPEVVKPAITSVAQGPSARLEQIVAEESAPKEAHQPKAQKISIDEAAKLTEEERIKLRKLRFGTLGTDNTIEEAERIRQERLKKFGGASQEVDKETLEKRKQKFGNVPQLGPEDPEIAKKRLEKFGSTGISLLSEDKSILQQRKKKFGNPETVLSLDEEISKSKPIKKFHPKHNNHKRFRDSHDHRR